MTTNETQILRGRGQGSPLYEALCNCSIARKENRADKERYMLIDIYDELDEEDQKLVLELHREVIRNRQFEEVVMRVAKLRHYLESLIDYGTK